MAQLTADQVNIYDVFPAMGNSLPVLASASIYRGSAVGSSGGYARQLVAGDTFMGFAEQTSKETLGTSGSVNVPVRTQGDIQVTLTGVAITNFGTSVYMSDGNTFTTSSSGNTLIGYVIRYISANTCLVRFDTVFQWD